MPNDFSSQNELSDFLDVVVDDEEDSSGGELLGNYGSQPKLAKKPVPTPVVEQKPTVVQPAVRKAGPASAKPVSKTTEKVHSIPNVNWILASYDSNGQLDLSMLNTMADVMKTSLTVLDANSVMKTWTPMKTRDNLLVLPEWELLAITNHTVMLAITNFTGDKSDKNQQACVKLVKNRLITWVNNENVKIPDSIPIFLVVDANNVEQIQQQL